MGRTGTHGCGGAICSEPVAVRDLIGHMPHICDSVGCFGPIQGARRARRPDRRYRAIWTAPDLGFLDAKGNGRDTQTQPGCDQNSGHHCPDRQPVTRAGIEEIRGASVSRGTVDQLLDLEWVKLGRRKLALGRLVTFPDHFGLERAQSTRV